MVTVQSPVPEQPPPLQPAKVDPPSAAAVKRHRGAGLEAGRAGAPAIDPGGVRGDDAPTRPGLGDREEIVRARAAVDQDGDAVVGGVGHRDVGQTVPVEVAEGDGGGTSADFEVLRKPQGSVAERQKHGERVGVTVGHRQVVDEVCVEVPRGHEPRAGPRRVGRRRLEASIAGAEQHGDVGGAPVRDDQIRETVPVEVADGDRLGAGAGGEGQRVLESPIAEAQQDREGVRGDDDEIRPAVSVEIAETDGSRTAAGGDHRLDLERPVAVAEQDGDVVGTRVCHRQVRMAVAVEVAHRHRLGGGARREGHGLP